MKTLTVCILRDKGLSYVDDQIIDLIENINKYLKIRGYRINVISDIDSEDFAEAISQSEVCLSMFWDDSDQIRNQMEAAYENLKAGNNPKKIYVYFKEPLPDDAKDGIREFKNSFVSKYGHFYCRFENEDTMKLNFIIQLESFMISNNEESILKSSNNEGSILKSRGGKLSIGGVNVVDMENIPFAKNDPEYLRLKSEYEDLRKKYVKDNNKGLKKEKELKKEIERKEEELRLYQERLLGLATELMKSSLEKTGELYDKARESFLEGKIGECNKTLDLNTLKGYAVEFKKDSQILNEKGRMLVDTFMLKAKAAMADNSPGRSLEDQVGEASDAYDEAASLAQKINGYDEKALSDIYFGNAELLYLYSPYLKEDKYAKATENYEKFYTIRKKLAGENPKLLAELAIAANNLGSVYLRTQRQKAAREKYQEAYLINECLASNGSSEDTRRLAISLSNIGEYYREVGQADKAMEKFSECYEVFKKIEKEDCEYFLSEAADTKLGMARLCDENKDFAKSEKFYNEAYSYLKPLIEKNSASANILHFADTCGEIGNFYKEQGKYDEAKEMLLEQYSLIEGLAESDPDEYIGELKIATRSIVSFYEDSMCLEDAQTLLTGSYEKFNDITDERFKPIVAFLAYTLGNLLQKIEGQETIAEEKYLEAYGLYKELAAKLPEIYFDDLEESAETVIYFRDDDKEAIYMEIFSLLEAPTKDDPKRNLKYLGDAAMLLGKCYSDDGDVKEAARRPLKVFNIYMDLSKEDPGTFLPEMLEYVKKLEEFYSNLNQHDDHKSKIFEMRDEIYPKVYEFCKEMARVDPNNLPHLAKAASLEGNFNKEFVNGYPYPREHYEKAKARYEEALSILEDLSSREKMTFDASLAEVALNLGEVDEELSEKGEAEKMYSRALGMYRSLSKSDYSFLGYMMQSAEGIKRLNGKGDKAEAMYTELYYFFKDIAEKVQNDDSRSNLVEVSDELIKYYENTENYPFARLRLKEMYHFFENLYNDTKGEGRKDISEKLSCYAKRIAVVCVKAGYTQDAEIWYLKWFDLQSELKGENDPEDLRQLAEFYSNSGNFQKSEYYYNRIYDIHKAESEERKYKSSDFAYTCKRFGNFYIKFNKYDKAEEKLLEAYSIFKDFYSEHSTYTPEQLDEISCSFVNLYSKSGNVEKEGHWRYEIYSLWKRAVDNGIKPHYCMGKFIDATDNLEKFYASHQEMRDECGTKYLELYSSLKSKIEKDNDRDKYFNMPLLAKAADMIGDFCNSNGRVHEAGSYYMDAYSIYRQLSQSNNTEDNREKLQEYIQKIERFMDENGEIDTAADAECPNAEDKTSLEHRMGEFYQDAGNLEKAEGCFLKEYGLRKDIAKGNSSANMARLFQSASFIGEFYRSQCRYDKALPMDREAYSIIGDLAKKKPGTYLSEYLKFSQEIVGAGIDIFRSGEGQADYEKAFSAEYIYGQAYAICKNLCKKDPERYLPCLAKVALLLGGQTERSSSMGEKTHEAYSIYLELARKEPETYLKEIDGIVERRLYVESAKFIHDDLIALFCDLAKKNSNEYLPELAHKESRYGVFCKKYRMYNDAIEHFGKSYSIRKKISEENPTHNNEFLLARSAESLSECYEIIGDLRAATEKLEEAYSIYERHLMESADSNTSRLGDISEKLRGLHDRMSGEIENQEHQ